MKLVLSARAEAVVAEDAEGMAAAMVEGVAVDAEGTAEAVVAGAEGAAVMAVEAAAIVDTNRRVSRFQRAREFSRALTALVKNYTAAICCFANAVLIGVSICSIFPPLYS